MTRQLARLGFVFLLAWVANCGHADDSPPTTPKPAEKENPDDAGLKRVLEGQELWIDPKRKEVVIGGQVCLREGQLELFACPKGTKEHEAIVSVNVKPRFIHAALMAMEAEPGTPVKWDPTYEPAKGQIIDVHVQWTDKDGVKQKVRAQEWIKQQKFGKAMSYDWVFVGSGFWVNDEGQRFYHADGGDFICVSNFATAQLDIPVPSSQRNDELLFTAFTERIPPKGTKIRLILTPRPKKPAEKTPAKPATP